MTALALRLSGHHNAVSRRHAEESRKMWHELWPAQEEGGQTRVDYVTNGVHVPTWVDPKVALLFERYFGPGWVDGHIWP